MNTRLFRSLKKLLALLAILTLLPSAVALADSGAHPGPVESAQGLSNMLPAGGTLYQAGADRLTALQNNDGGWDWPLDDGNPASVSPANTVGPIAQGLAMAYLHTGDAAHRAALQDAGAFLLAKTNNFSPSDGYLAATLDMTLGGTTYTHHLLTHYYGPLHNGTY